MNFEFKGNKFQIETLNTLNLKETYEFCENNSDDLSLSYEVFKGATIESLFFHPELSLIVRDTNKQIICFFMLVFRPSYVPKRKVGVLKFFVVEKRLRKQGLGTEIYKFLIRKIKLMPEKDIWMKLEVMSSQPDYLFPGLNPKLTSALLFLRNLGFKKYNERINLIVDLKKLKSDKPPEKKGNVKISRATIADKEKLMDLAFMPIRYQLISWSEEILLSYQNKPRSTFVAKLHDDKIIGFATHSVGFPGSFGPIGIMKKYRNNDLGKTLLNWCIWDLKRKDIDSMIIRWIDENVLSFYSKTLGAKISNIFWALKTRI
ncbi:MAG: GNAT family N-acetyltransferase [Promethearchaeota archaeon]|nr:MAG: GNAT family N-acetyltransferase [Candidatus Lokiarchaeota archaeon]